MKAFPFSQRWQSLATQDRRALTLAAVVLSALAVWQWGIAPAWRTVQTAPAQLDQARGQLQRMQTLAQEANSLQAQGNAPAGNRPETLAAIQQVTQQTLGTNAQVLPQGDRVRVNLTEVSGPDLATWLAQLRGLARVSVQEVQIQVANASGNGSRWNGMVLLAGTGLQNP